LEADDTAAGSHTRTVHEADWAEAWKAYFPVLRVGRRLVIRPTWLTFDGSGDEVVLDLDPGMAFGTGLHPTTRLCLAALESVADRGILGGSRVLDVGCGSGILSIAAAKLGAELVLGLDIDPIAIEATQANAATNGLAGRIAARAGSLPSGEPPFDVVVANLIASVLVAFAEGLVINERLVGAHARGGVDVVALGLADERVQDGAGVQPLTDERLQAIDQRVLVRAVERVAGLEGDDALPALLAEERPHLARRQHELAEARMLRLRQHVDRPADQMGLLGVVL
jgi:ribosomal protein L11 methyltransferase